MLIGRLNTGVGCLHLRHTAPLIWVLHDILWLLYGIHLTTLDPDERVGAKSPGGGSQEINSICGRLPGCFKYHPFAAPAEKYLHGMAIATQRMYYFLMLESLVQLSSWRYIWWPRSDHEVSRARCDFLSLTTYWSRDRGMIDMAFHEDAKPITIQYSSLNGLALIFRCENQVT